MKRHLFLSICLAAGILMTSCHTGNSTKNQVSENNSPTTELQEPKPNQEQELVFDLETEEDPILEEEIFEEDIAKKVFNLMKVKGIDFPKDRVPEEYSYFQSWDGVQIICFKKNDGNYLVYYNRFTECEGDREIIERDFYTLENETLTKATEDFPFASLTLDDFSDELGKKDFMDNALFVNDHEKVWNDFSAEIASEYDIERVNSRIIEVSPMYDNNLKGTYALKYYWDGNEFIKCKRQDIHYLSLDGFGPIMLGQKFPDLSGLKHYSATQDGESFLLKKDGKIIASFLIKDNHVKEYEVYSPNYTFSWGERVGAPIQDSDFDKIKRDENGKAYVGTKSRHYYVDESGIIDKDSNTPKLKEGALITRIRVIGADRKKFAHDAMPKKITVMTYKDPNSWDETTDEYTLNYDSQNRVTAVFLNGDIIYEVEYSDSQIVVKDYSNNEFAEFGVMEDIYMITDGVFTQFQHGEMDPMDVVVENGYFKNYQPLSDGEVENVYTWDDAKIMSRTNDLENLNLYFDYDRSSRDYWADRFVIDLSNLIIEGYLKIDAATFFCEGPVICRSEYIPKTVVYDGCNVKAKLNLGGISSDGLLTNIRVSDNENHNRLFTRNITIEY